MAATTEQIGVQRVTRGILANILGQGINACTQLVLVPVLLAYWGTQRYGEWVTLSAAIMYLAMIDFGMQNFVVNRLNQSYVNRDLREHTRVLHSALVLSLLFCGLALSIVVPLLVAMPIGRWFHFASTDPRTVSLVAVLLAFQVVGSVPNGLIGGVYRSVGEYPRGQMVTNSRNLATLTLSVLVVACGGGLAWVAGAQLAALGGATLFMLRDLPLRHPDLSIGLRGADLRLALSFLAPSSLFMLIQLSMALTVQGSTLLLGSMFGALSVAIFVPLRTLSNLIRQIIGALFSALWPEFTALEAAGRYDALRNAHLLVAKVLVTASIAAALFLHFAGATIVSFWTHNRITFNAPLMDALLLLLLSQSVWLTSSLVLASSNNHREMAWVSFTSAVIGLVAGYFAARRFGMAGLVYGIWLTEFSLTGAVVMVRACRLLKQSFGGFLLEVVARGVAVALGAGAAVATVSLLTIHMYSSIRMILLCAGASVATLGLAYGVYLNASERATLRSWASRFRPAKSAVRLADV